MKRKRSPRRASLSRVATMTQVCEEVLPWPWVQYPNHYGAFFAFAGEEKGPFALCSCSIAAVQNAIRLAANGRETYADPLRRAPLSNHYFSDQFSVRSLDERANPIAWLRFEARLCHRCNLATPSLRYCHEMYGGRFVQAFGWYVNQTFFRLGIQPLSLCYLEDVCPIEVATKIRAWQVVEAEHQSERTRLMSLVYGPARQDIAPDERTYWSNVKFGEEERYVTLRRRAGQLRQAVINEVESVTRKDFGFRAVGDGWISESIVFNIVKRLFANDEVIRHHRPDWLNGLELDIFIPAHKLAIEYQGQQHFRAIQAWGGESSLRLLQGRDARKAKLCAREGIRLIAIDYTEPLNQEHIESRIGFAGGTP